MSAPAVVVHVAFALLNARDEAAAEALLNQLDNPFVRRLARQEWQAMRDRDVTTLETP